MSEENEKHSSDLHFMTKTVCSKNKEHGKGNEPGVSSEIVPEIQAPGEEKVKHSTDLHFMTTTASSKAKEHGKESGADASPETSAPKRPIKNEEKVKGSPDSHFMAKTACSKAKEHEKANESVIITEITVSKSPIKSEEKVKGSRGLHFMTKTTCSKAKEHGKIDESGGAGVKIAVSKSPVVKSEDKDSPSLHFMSKTTCFKAKEHGKSTAVPKFKPATHSGLKLRINLNKVTTVKPFTFDSPEKTTPRTRERSPGKRTIIEEKVKGAEKHVRITTEQKRTSKESREFSTSRSSRSVSRERTANGTTKSSTRSSGAKSSVSKKSTPKTENKPTSAIKSTSHIQKPTQSSAAKTHAKHSGDQHCSPSDKSKVVSSSSETTVEFEMMKSESHTSTVEMSERVLSNGMPMRGKHLNGEIDFSRGSRIESDLLNDAKLENLLNELNLECEIANAMTGIDSVSTKNVSKIPRKRGGPQSDAKISSTDDQKKSTNTQPHSFDNGIIANGKKESMVMVSEMNTVQITNVN